MLNFFRSLTEIIRKRKFDKKSPTLFIHITFPTATRVSVLFFPKYQPCFKRFFPQKWGNVVKSGFLFYFYHEIKI